LVRSCFRGHGGDRAHVVQAVGQLDDQDPQVLGSHNHEHLRTVAACALRGVELEPVEQ
jgi:hypothetical protein